MNTDQTTSPTSESGPPETDGAAVVVPGSARVTPRAATGVSRVPSGSHGLTKRRGPSVIVLALVVLLTVGLGAVWSFIAQRELTSALVVEGTQHLDQAAKAFEAARVRTQANLQGHCRVLVEDPRLKSTLATEGMDEATIADILTDLGKLRGAGFLMVLSPEGRVFAEAGAPELRGLDLSNSSVVKKAQSGTEAAIGSWVLGGKVMDLSIMAVRYGDSIIAYLAVGESIDEKALQAVAEQTGVQAASALGTTIALASSSDSTVKQAFSTLAADAGTFQGRVLTVSGQTYVTGAVALAETAQAHRLVLARPLAAAMGPFERLKLLMFVPPALMLIGIMFSMSASRSLRRK